MRLKDTLSVGVLFAFSVAQGQVVWTESSAEHGLTYTFQELTSYGGGVSFFDFDKDGWDDITLASGDGEDLFFFRNVNGNFEEVPSPLGMTDRTNHPIWVDYDNDGDYDLFATANGENRLFRRDAGFTFTDVSGSAGLTGDSQESVGACWGDYDLDGDLDLYLINYTEDTTVTNYLYRNDGNDVFTDVTVATGVADGHRLSLACAFLDYNNDRYPDLFVANDKTGENSLYENNGNGTFTDVSVAANANQVIDAMNAGIGDYDDNGYLDIYVTNTPPTNILLQNQGNGTFVRTDSVAGVGYGFGSWAGNFFDYDNDIDLDLYVSGSATGLFGHNGFYQNQGDGTFEQITPTNIEDNAGSYAQALGDMNRDGYYDMFVHNRGGTESDFWVSSGGTNNYVRLNLQGTVSNRDAVGSWIKFYVDGSPHVRYTHCGLGFLGQHAGYEILGLDTFDVIDSLIIDWPSGMQTVLTDIDANQSISVIEGTSHQAEPYIAFQGLTTICNGDSIELSVGNYASYLWSTGDTSPTLMVDQAGTYNVEIIDQWGNTVASDSITIGQYNAIAGTTSGTDLSCYTDSFGTASVTVSGGVPPFTYDWAASSSMNSDVVSVAAGLHTVTVTDQANCTFETSVMVNSPDSFEVIGTTSDVLCAGGTSGSVAVNVAGATPPYQYAWTGGGSNAQLDNLAAGTYDVLVTDANGCTITFEGTITEPTALAHTLSETPAQLNGSDGTATVTVTGGTPPYTYSWNDPAAQTTETATGLENIVYEVTVTDANGCSFIDSIHVGPTVSIFENALTLQQLKVYPQPAHDQLTVELPESKDFEGKLVLRDLSGRIVLSQEQISGNIIQLDIQGIAKGIYNLEWIHGESVHGVSKVQVY